MGASVGTGDGKKSVNVELNIVPFIDLMSCLTAFLLVTAVWVNIAQINIQPKGKNRDTQQVQQDDETVTLSVLVQADRIWVGLSRVNEFQEIRRRAINRTGRSSRPRSRSTRPRRSSRTVRPSRSLVNRRRNRRFRIKTSSTRWT